MKKNYISPLLTITEVKSHHMICASNENQLFIELGGNAVENGITTADTRRYNVWDDDWSEE